MSSEGKTKKSTFINLTFYLINFTSEKINVIFMNEKKVELNIAIINC